MLMWALIGMTVGALLLWRRQRKNYHLPPGPRGIPFLGNIFQLDKNCPHGTLTKWADEYGDVFRIKMFGEDSVILNSYESIYEGMVTKAKDFAGRPSFYRTNFIRRWGDNIAFTTYSRKWLFLKKTTMQALKMYGDNLENLEMITLSLIREMFDELKEISEKEEAVDVRPSIHACVTGIITSVLYGHKVGRSEVSRLLEATDKSVKALETTGVQVLIDVMPLFRYLLRATHAKLVEVRSLTESWFAREIHNRKEKHLQGNPQCVLDALLDVQQRCLENNEEFQLTDDSIYGINADIVFGGTITTSVSLQCLIAILVNKPEIQQRMADHIIKEIGDREPRLTDRPALAYIEATILELLRYSSIFPLNIPHYTTVDTTINEYDIPRNTRVVFNLWKMHHDPKYWHDPWEFNPERFLDPYGAVVPPDHTNRKRLLAFGASRRVCIGEALAKNRLFLMVTSLIQHFRFLSVSPEMKPSHDPRSYISGFGTMPKDYSVKLLQRK